MKKKLLILSLLIAVLFLFSVSISSVNAGEKSIPVNWQVVGSIANNVEVSVMISPEPPTFRTIPHFLISLSAQGSPGPAEITLMGYGSVVELDNCTAGEIEIHTSGSDMVARFPDLSLLFASDDGTNESYLCLNPVAGQSTFVSNMLITGGTGRFEEAEGAITGTGFGYYFSGGALAGEVGKITGSIDFPD